MFYNSYFMRHFTSTCFILEFFKEKIHYVQQSLDTVHVFSNTQFISFELFKLSFWCTVPRCLSQLTLQTLNSLFRRCLLFRYLDPDPTLPTEDTPAVWDIQQSWSGIFLPKADSQKAAL